MKTHKTTFTALSLDNIRTQHPASTQLFIIRRLQSLFTKFYNALTLL